MMRFLGEVYFCLTFDRGGDVPSRTILLLTGSTCYQLVKRLADLELRWAFLYREEGSHAETLLDYFDSL